MESKEVVEKKKKTLSICPVISVRRLLTPAGI
jgi:hypothetical protein